MKLALVRMSNAGDIETNLNKSLTAISEAALNGADIVLFPEVHLTEFFPQYYFFTDFSYSENKNNDRNPYDDRHWSDKI